MILERLNPVHTDVLVIGGGGAGLRAAIAAAESGARVVLTSDTHVGRGSLTAISGGAFACTSEAAHANHDGGWFGHFEDTVLGGRYLGNQELALELARAIQEQAGRISAYGVKYDGSVAPGWLKYCIDPGHHAAKMYYGSHAIGTDLTFPMAAHAARLGVDYLAGMLATRLLVDGRRVIGALALDTAGRVVPLVAGSTVLATGGAGHMYQNTDNSPGATGDGYVLAYEAGLPLCDMEFMQFYPTALYSGTPGVYYEILVAGINAPLLNSRAENIRLLHGLEDPHSITRDRLSIAIMKEVAEGRGIDGGVLLDLSGIPSEIREAIGPALPRAAQRGHNVVKVAPTAHTHLGGVRIDTSTATALQGLYAAGEVTCGVHGANRLGGNALSEVLVFGAIAGRNAAHFAATHRAPLMEDDLVAPERHRLGSLLGPQDDRASRIRATLKDVMWRSAGVLRGGESLAETLHCIGRLKAELDSIRAPAGRPLQRLIKTANLLSTAEMVCVSARHRTESRGAHFRTDYPAENNDEWLRSVVLQKGPEGPEVSTESVALSHFKPNRP